MSFFTNTSQQMTLDDSTYHLTGREQKALEKSWAKVFAEEVFPLIDEEPFRVLYCQDNGAPNTPVNIIVGASIIKELLDLSDDEVVEGVRRGGHSASGLRRAAPARGHRPGPGAGSLDHRG